MSLGTKTGPLTEANMPLKRPLWEDIVHVVGEQKNVFLALLKKGTKPGNAIHNWPARDLDAGGYGGTGDGTPAGGNAKRRDYGSLSNAVEWNREEWKVSKYAENTDAYGIAYSEHKKEQKAAALNRLKDGMEKLFLSEQDAAVEDGETPFRCRGIGSILAATGHNAQFPIPEALRVPSECIFSNALDTFGEDDLEAMLSAAASELNGAVTWDGFVGPRLKRRMDLFAARDPNASATNVAMRQFTQNGRDGEFVSMVDVFKFSVGIARVHINFNLFCDSDGVRNSVRSAGGGYFLDMSRFRIAFMEDVYHKDLTDDDSGATGVYGYMATLKYGVPKGQAMVRPSALTS